jgi:chemotaxis signal transduction protein
MSADSFLRCAVGTREYVFRSEDVRHVTRTDQLRADPIADGRVGAVKLAGQDVPVFALGRALGLDDTPRLPEQHIAVTGDQHELVGWLVDHVGRANGVDDCAMATLPAAVGQRAASWFEGLVSLADGARLLLITPGNLNPLRAEGDRREGPAFAAPAQAAGTAPADPMALVFSTSVLPRCEARRYALSGRQVAAIVRPSDQIELPGSANHVAGLTLWRQLAVPILDFRESDDRGAAKHRRRIIAQSGGPGGCLVAFSIDADVVVHRPAATNRLVVDVPCPPFAAGMFDIDGEAVALLDLDALLASPACVGA